MTRYLSLDELLRIADAAAGVEVVVRDAGLLESALGRPRATIFGDDAYPDIHTKAAALLHSLARNHALERRQQAVRPGRPRQYSSASTGIG